MTRLSEDRATLPGSVQASPPHIVGAVARAPASTLSRKARPPRRNDVMTPRGLRSWSLVACLASLSAGCQLTLTEHDGDAAVEDAGTATDAGDGLTTLRLAVLSPDAPAVDFCIAPYGTSAFGTPLIAQIADQLDVDGSDGLSFGQVSVYMLVPAGRYALRVVEAGDSSCSMKLIADTTLDTFSEDAWHTVALVGDLSVAGSDPAASIAVFEDDSEGKSGYARLRFIHAVPGMAALDFGLRTSDGDFDTLFTCVQFGKAGSVSPYGLLDANGYLKTGALSSQDVEAHPISGETFAELQGNVTIATGTLGTFFAIGGKTDDASAPAHLLWCEDLAGIGGYLGACFVVSNL